MCWMLLLFMSLKNTYICSFIHQLDHSWIFGTIVNTRNTMVSKIFFPQPLKRSLQSSFSWSQTRKEAASLEDDTLWDGQARLPGEGTWLNPRPAALPSQYKTKAETWKVVGWGSDGVLDRERRWQVQSPRARESSVHRQSSVSSLELPVIQNEGVQKVVKKKKKKDWETAAESTSQLQSASWATLCYLTFILRAGFPKMWPSGDQDFRWCANQCVFLSFFFLVANGFYMR